MKNLFLPILSILLLASCNGIDESDLAGENPVLGVWNAYHQDTDSLIMTRVFTLNFYSYFSYAEGKKQEQYNKQQYTIMEDQIILRKYTQTFKIVGDTLWITNSMQDQTTKYIKDKWTLPDAVE